ncbi:hypothetical protein [Actinorugispora endophytica]|uniref:Uncharacterized protein n=1 Tax=Actinorugispora endophytica TaxID=1605990 RepID=A0A4R6V2N3_9ACTN|nr:hypothetical protein [Actinorugispora endophytica]TDQ54434.1 hypothetical protein EV190_102268 [Actinorugispora endophytica]
MTVSEPESAAIPEGVTVSVSLVQVLKGGEPDDHGLSLAGRRSPLRPAITGACACATAVLPYDLWEALERHDLYSPDTDVWVRVIDPDAPDPLPEGAVLLETRTVVYGTDGP